MKASTLTLLLVATAAPFAVAGAVSPGDSMAEVKAVLGTPKGQVMRDGRQILYFERGAVEMVSGRVMTVSLRTAEEQADLTTREERQRVEREVIRARLAAEGVALRDRKLADGTFQSAPLAYQVNFWENFALSYPGVSCAEPLMIARMRFNEQLEDKRRREAESDRRAQLEERLAAAERETTFYPIQTYVSYLGRHHYERGASLGPISYHFNDTGLSPYSTPAGNPAGSLNGPVVDGIYARPTSFEPGNPARAEGNGFNRSHQRQVGGWRDRF